MQMKQDACRSVQTQHPCAELTFLALIESTSLYCWPFSLWTRQHCQVLIQEELNAKEKLLSQTLIEKRQGEHRYIFERCTLLEA